MSFFPTAKGWKRGKRGYIYPQNVIIRVKTIRECAKEMAPFFRRKYTAFFMEKCVKIHIACSFNLLSEFHQFHSDIMRKLHRRRSLHRVRSVRNASSYNQHLQYDKYPTNPSWKGVRTNLSFCLRCVALLWNGKGNLSETQRRVRLFSLKARGINIY